MICPLEKKMNIILLLILSAQQQISFSSPQNTTGQTFTNLNQFMGDLYNRSHSLSDFAIKIQAVFCSQQPLCSSSGVLERKNIIDAITSSIIIDGEIVKPDELSTLAGMCCLPCVCEESCLENDKCCLTKHVNDFESGKMPPSPDVKSECIAATSKSYVIKSNLSRKYPRYSMITQCYKNMGNNVTSNKCQQPNHVVPDETFPVTSLRTNRTYWNKYCAACNNDVEEILQWNATTYSIRDFVYFANKHVWAQMEDFVHFFECTVKAEGLVYSKPNGIENSRCLRKEELRQPEFNTSSNEVSWFIQMACERFHSPLYAGSTKGVPYKNIFCYLYFNGYEFTGTESNNTPDCMRNIYRDLYSKMTALLNYEHIDSDTSNQVPIEVRQDHPKCSCTNIFDTAMKICRAIYCPPGEGFVGCECKPFVNQFSGIPVALKLKVRRMRGLDMPVLKTEVRKVGGALTKALRGKYRQITVELLAVFAGNISIGNNYQVYIAVARTLQGFDTKETLKGLAECLESPSFLQFTAMRNILMVEVSNRIELWRESGIFHAKSINEDTELELIYQDNKVDNSLGRRRLYQELSPLLYCKQVQLNQSEFMETGAIVHVNISSAQYQTVNYYHTTSTMIRVCADEFLNAQGMSSGTSHLSVIISLYMCLSNCFLYIVLSIP